MKRSILVFAIMAGALISRSQTLTWQWATNATGAAEDAGRSIITDHEGNSIVAGHFSGTLIIGSTPLIARGGSDIFIAKYSVTGQPIWAQRCMGRVNDICTDNDGNTYITGELIENSDFGLDTIEVDGGNATQIFVSKISNTGSFIWSKAWGGSGNDQGNGITYNKESNSIGVTGRVGDVATFDTYTIDAGFGNDILVLKIDTSGSVLWVKNAGSTGVISAGGGFSIGSDSLQNFYVTGCGTSSNTVFDPIVVPECYIFVTKYNGNGIVQWAKGISVGPSSSTITNSQTDKNGNTYIVGYNSLNDLTYHLDNLMVSTSKSFLAKYDQDGVVHWAKKIGEFDHYTFPSVTTNSDDAIYITTGFSNTAMFDNDTLISDGFGDIAVAKFDTAGNNIWAIKAGGESGEGSMDITANSNSVFVTGSISGSNSVFGDYTINSTGLSDMFIAKLSETTGILETTKNKQLLIYPTPANDAVYVSGVQKAGTYKITSVTGAVVKEGTMYQGINRIDIAQLASGMYLLYAGNEVHKIVKE